MELSTADLLVKSLMNQRDIRPWGIVRHPSKTGSGPTFSECRLAGRIFRDMLFQFFTINRLKRAAAAVQCVYLCKIRMAASQITPFDPVGGHPCVFCHCTPLLPKGFEIQLPFIDVGAGPIEELFHGDTIANRTVQCSYSQGSGVFFLGPDG